MQQVLQKPTLPALTSLLICMFDQINASHSEASGLTVQVGPRNPSYLTAVSYTLPTLDALTVAVESPTLYTFTGMPNT